MTLKYFFNIISTIDPWLAFESSNFLRCLDLTFPGMQNIIDCLICQLQFFVIIIKLMAFVIETERKVNEVSKTMNLLGPGQYFK